MDISLIHSKIGKFLIKTIYMFPLGYLAWIIKNGTDIEHPYIAFVAGIGIAALIVFLHVFDYEKFDDIKTEDFLESKHSFYIDYSERNWSQIREVLKSQFIQVVNFKESDGFIFIQIDKRFFNSVLIVEKIDQKINLRIKRKNFNFFPDNADNYRTIKTLIKVIK